MQSQQAESIFPYTVPPAEDPNFGFIVESYLGSSNTVGPKKG